MLAEVLLLLSGHQSSLFIPHPAAPSSPKTLIVSPHLEEYLHPGEITSLNKLSDIAFKYGRIKSWATAIQKEGRQGILLENLTSSSSSRKGKQRELPEHTQQGDTPNQYMTTLAESMVKILKEYEILIVEIEHKILSFDPTLVQDNLGYVPLSSIIAKFDKWKIPLDSLSSLIDELSQPNSNKDGDTSTLTPGRLIDLIQNRTQNGNPFLSKIYSEILSNLTHLFLTHLVTFMLFGTAPTKISKTLPSLGIDIGSDPLSPKYRIYQLNNNLLPSSIDGRTKESILYIGRVTSTLKREGRSLPRSLIDGLREEIVNIKGLDELNGLSDAILRARAEVGEWLWKHVLTGPQIIESIEFLSNYFLTRKSDFSHSFLRELDKLRIEKLVISNPNSSSSVIKEQDLNLVLLRSSLTTSAENDRSLEMLRFRMDKGPLRAIPILPNDMNTGRESGNHSHTYKLFSSTLLGTPITLTTSITWPLDLFLSPKSLSIYSDINSYLLALRDTQMRITNTWLLLSNNEKNKRNSQIRKQNTKNHSAEENVAEKKKLNRSVWNLIRMINWFINELLIHFMDIIETQHHNLLEQLDIQVKAKEKEGLNGSIRGSLRGSTIGRRSSIAPSHHTTHSRKENTGIPHSPLSESHTTGWEERPAKSNKAPPTPTKMERNYIDFLTLRSIHSRHLSFLLEALLLSDPSTSTITRDILESCKRFTGLIERWNGDLSPDQPENTNEEEWEDLQKERYEAIKEIDETLHDLILEFFGTLLDSQDPPASSTTNNGEREGEKSIIDVGAGSRSFSRTSRINQISKIMNRQLSFTQNSTSKIGLGNLNKNKSFDSGVLGIGIGLERHVEQLLLRLDYNGILTKWRDMEINGGEEVGIGNTHSVLVPGGL